MELIEDLSGGSAAVAAEGRREVVLVTGATGRTGQILYASLRDAGYAVRALVRTQSKAQEVLNCGACAEADGVFVGDVTDLSSLAAPMAGADVLVILTSSVPLPGAVISQAICFNL